MFTNKKIVLIVFAIIIASIIGIVVLVTPNKKETDNKNDNSQIEQSEDGEVFQDDKEYDSLGLEVLKPDEVAPENFSNASGSWDDSASSDRQNNDENKADKSDNNNPDKEEDILTDDITWGTIY